MVDVLGISLIRLLEVCQKEDYDKISDSINTFIKNKDNTTNRIVEAAVRRLRESVSNVAFSRGVFENLVSRYKQLESGRGIVYGYKCPTHGTFMQSEDEPFPHWSCWFWKGCTYKKDAVAMHVPRKELHG